MPVNHVHFKLLHSLLLRHVVISSNVFSKQNQPTGCYWFKSNEPSSLLCAISCSLFQDAVTGRRRWTEHRASVCETWPDRSREEGRLGCMSSTNVGTFVFVYTNLRGESFKSQSTAREALSQTNVFHNWYMSKVNYGQHRTLNKQRGRHPDK